MPTWYTPATKHDYDLLRSVIDESYPDLVEANATIGLILAHPDPESGKPPLMKNKLQVLAKIKPNSEADRVDGKPDATITLDAAHWAELMDEEADGRDQARALIDHELYHLEVRREKDSGRVLTDDAGRPKFNTQPHDWEITGFRVVAERHKQHAVEVIEARRFHDKYGNLLFNFAEEHAVQRSMDFATEVLGMTAEAVAEVNRDHARAGMPWPFVGKIVEEAADRINAGEIGPGVTAEVNPGRRRRAAPAVVAAANR